MNLKHHNVTPGSEREAIELKAREARSRVMAATQNRMKKKNLKERGKPVRVNAYSDICNAYSEICLTLSPLDEGQQIRVVKSVAIMLGMVL
jgi:hypothetical protein